MNELVVKQVDFMGDSLLATQDIYGNIWVGVSYICKGIGLNKNEKNRQIQNVQSDEVISRGCIKFGAGVFDPNNETIALRLDYVPLWLAKISITPAMKEENPEVVKKLVEYQLKVKDILAQAFLSGKAPIDTAKLSPELQLFKQMFDTVVSQHIKTLEIERQQDKQQTEIEILKGKIDIINDSEFTIVGYCNLHNIPIDHKTTISLDIKATKLSKQKGYRIGRVTHPIWGGVNTYHMDILDILIDKL